MTWLQVGWENNCAADVSSEPSKKDTAWQSIMQELLINAAGKVLLKKKY